MYNRTSAPNPADGIPILPRTKYWSYIRSTQLSPGSGDSAFSLDLEFYRFLGFAQISNNTRWDREPLDGGYKVSLSPTSAPTGYPSPADYFSGDVVITKNGNIAGHLTLGWINPYIRKFTLEIGTVPGVKKPSSTLDGRHTFHTAFNAAGYDITVEYGADNIPEPSNPDLPPGMFTRAQQHEAAITHRNPTTDFDKEWRIYLLIARLLQGTERGEMIDGKGEFNGVPREVAVVSTDWIVGTKWDGSNDTALNWGPTTGNKYAELHDAWFRTCVHEAGHFFDLTHPFEWVEGVMTDTTSYVAAGNEGVTEQKWPENMGDAGFEFAVGDVFLMGHLSDLHVRPGYVKWGASYSEPPTPLDLS